MKQDHDSSVFGVEAKDTGQPSVARFTPGPWSLNKYGSIGAGAGWHCPIIASVEPFYGVDERYGSHRANACLIAAAPDLYEALLAQDNAVEEHSKCECRHHFTGMCNKCTFRYLRASQLRQAALAKAVPQMVLGTPSDTSNTDSYPNTTTGPTGESDG